MTAITTNLFVYGSLADPRCLDEVLGRRYAQERLRARLVGYRRIANSVYPYPFIVVAPADAVDGILLLDLSAKDLDVLDDYEEVASGTYTRVSVEVEAWGCGSRAMRLPAHTYIAGVDLIRSTTS
jgi:gamma-glutamylcyclotransferase (GGCT)/AIG2-like uncharacterized protein YtfP